jgi:hypothetical protein
VGVELCHEDGKTDIRTDMTKPTVSFRNYANAPTNGNEQSSFCHDQSSVMESAHHQNHHQQKQLIKSEVEN